eukprot:gnl/TRDRNA2_/TRDRNA2_195240_c0_seq1.p1 gnl/TRDRNA2_/TRDRNA2_195240_c0~~gnl/TRDRNA2_/TRDRNA2_195240_c0_seq1.p1  ORF type:complete len:479 (+),score=111.87 gnl/TRDRNA2_/TRDRNA2_195240_c0_seq1:70-1506(+)
MVAAATETAAAAPAAPVAATPAQPQYVCFLCKRAFGSIGQLNQHKQLSDLHRRNLAKQEIEAQQRKEEMRQACLAARREIRDFEATAEKKQILDDLEYFEKRSALDQKLKQALGDYGHVQEKIEAGRGMRIASKNSVNSGSAPRMRPDVYETRLGKLLISAGVASWQGNKEVQEDRYALEITLESADGQRIIGFGVYDGHAGSLCVDALLESLPRNLQKCLSLKAALTEETLREAVLEACTLVDSEFLVQARERAALDGSCALLALIFPAEGRAAATDYRLLVVNLGDSRAVLCKSSTAGSESARTQGVRLSDDQKPGRPDERRRIENNGGVVGVRDVCYRVFTPGLATLGGRSLVGGLSVSRAFGDLLMKEPQRYGCPGVTGALVSAVPEIHAYDLHLDTDRFLVLACDGVWDVVDDQEAVTVCAEHRHPDRSAHALVRRSFEIGSDDNLTAVVITWRLSDESLSEDRSDAKKARTA